MKKLILNKVPLGHGKIGLQFDLKNNFKNAILDFYNVYNLLNSFCNLVN